MIFNDTTLDPSTLERPKGYESTALDQGDHHTPPEELEKRDGPDVKGFRRF